MEAPERSFADSIGTQNAQNWPRHDKWGIALAFFVENAASATHNGVSWAPLRSDGKSHGNTPRKCAHKSGQTEIRQVSCSRILP